MTPDAVQQRGNVCEFEVRSILKRNRAQLEEWTRVSFEQQAEFRERLLNTIETGEQSVDQLVYSLRLALRNGSSDSTGWTASDVLGNSRDC